jgi:protein-tyrosine phosphatase
MLHVRRRIYTWLERAALASGTLGPSGLTPLEQPRRVIFVCTGNICRSPYAEFVARTYGLEALSCGTHTTSGRPADRTAMEEAQRRGVDMKNHLTTRWQELELRAGDLIVTMQLRHALTVRPRAHQHGCYVVMLNAYLLPDFAVIWDPYGRPATDYRASFDLIDAGVGRLAQHVQAHVAQA